MPIYNVPGVGTELKFTGPLLADIFLGKVTKWNDAAIAKANPGVSLPGTDIVVVHRSDGSGTTYIFADYLAKVSPEWKSKVGVNGSLNWPTGIGGKGSDGVTGQVRQTPGSIGYTELTYALTNKVTYGSVQNSAGKFVKASTESVTAAAAAAAAKMPDGLPRLDHQRPGRCRLSALVVHLAAVLREPGRQGPGQGDGRVHEVGAQRRTEVRAGDGLRTAADVGRRSRAGGAGEDQDAVDGQASIQHPSRRDLVPGRDGPVRACC